MNEQFERAKAAWVAKARETRDKLVSLVACYHPATKTPVRKRMKVTAGAAQAACDNVSAAIKATTRVNPVTQLETALDAGDMGQIYSVLSSAWFGVPESRSCWEVEGFSEAVELLENWPVIEQFTGSESDDE